MNLTQRYPSSNKRVSYTNYKCRNCSTMVIKYINTTPDEFIGKYLCLCVNSEGDPVGPQFPLYEVEQ